jgi:hypothetical protein
LCVSQHGEFKNITKKLLGKVHVKKVEKTKTSPLSGPCRFPPSICFYRVFCRFSAWGAQKHHNFFLLKIKPENLKKPQKK